MLKVDLLFPFSFYIYNLLPEAWELHTHGRQEDGEDSSRTATSHKDGEPPDMQLSVEQKFNWRCARMYQPAWDWGTRKMKQGSMLICISMKFLETS